MIPATSFTGIDLAGRTFVVLARPIFACPKDELTIGVVYQLEANHTSTVNIVYEMFHKVIDHLDL